MKITISLSKKPRLRKPVLICAWPGMGEVAFKLGLYLRDKLKMEEFGTLLAPELFPPTGIWIENNLVQLPKAGIGKFYFYKNKAGSSDLIVFLSDAQPLLEHAYEYCKKILLTAKDLKVYRIFSFAAMPQPIDHTLESQVWFCATGKKLFDELNSLNLGLKTLSAGQVSGLNGLFLGVAKEFGFEGACFLGEIPLFTIQMDNPKASLAILNKLSRLLRIDIDVGGLVQSAKLMEQESDKIIEFIQQIPSETGPGPIGQDEIDKIKKSLSLQTKLPQSAREKIEKLFPEVKSNISKAAELKRELDHWNVYKEYEDRFLDLFKKPKASEEKKLN